MHGNLNAIMRLLFVICLWVSINHAAFANTSQSGVAESRKIIDPAPIIIDWLNKPWTGDDSPYAAARSQVEADELAGDLNSKIDDYHADFLAHPDNLAFQVRYLYAIWLNGWENGVNYSWEEQQDIATFTVSLTQKKYPNTYNFTRMSAIFCALWDVDRDMYPFLQRLLRQDPNDIIAQYELPGMLAATNKPALQLQAITDANELVAKYPGIAAIWTDLGSVYYLRWKATKNPADAQNAIAAYEKYLALTTPTDYFRSDANWYIAQMQKS